MDKWIHYEWVDSNNNAKMLANALNSEHYEFKAEGRKVLYRKRYKDAKKESN